VKILNLLFHAQTETINHRSKHQNKHATIKSINKMDISAFGGKPILGKNHPVVVVLLNILLSYEQIIHGSNNSYESED